MKKKHLRSTQQSGMWGVYLVAADLTRRGWIVSPTSRSAAGADLLITDSKGKHVYAVQVKTNTRTFGFWIMNAKTRSLKAPSLIYAFVNIRNGTQEIQLASSRSVAFATKKAPKSATRKQDAYYIKEDKVRESLIRLPKP
jgi:hypothetical protein